MIKTFAAINHLTPTNIFIVLAKTCSLKTRSPMCPKFVVDFAELNTADPDKSFNSTYNWYYTDGTLDVIEDNGLNVLLHPSMIESQISKYII